MAQAAGAGRDVCFPITWAGLPDDQRPGSFDDQPLGFVVKYRPAQRYAYVQLSSRWLPAMVRAARVRIQSGSEALTASLWLRHPSA